MEEKIIPMRYDYVFKKIFADPEDLSILTAFLSTYFEIDYKSLEGRVTLLQGELPKENKHEKGMRLDLLVLLPNGEEVNIEMNNYNPGIERNLGYLCMLYGKQFKVGKYEKPRKCIQINFNCYPSEGDPIEIYKILNEEGKELTETFEIHQINVEKCFHKCYNIVNGEVSDKERWGMMMMLDHFDIFQMELEKMDLPVEVKEKLLRKMKEVSEKEIGIVYYQEDKERYEREHAYMTGEEKGIEEGLQMGLEQGLEQGSMSEKFRMAKVMKERNISLEEIASITDLKLDQIKNL